MNVSPVGAQTTAPNEWKIRLPCGHAVAVPWGSAVPAQMACVVQHQSECFEPLSSYPPSWWAVPLDAPGLSDRP
jgi:hypothetical protein